MKNKQQRRNVRKEKENEKATERDREKEKEWNRLYVDFIFNSVSLLLFIVDSHFQTQESFVFSFNEALNVLNWILCIKF